ncbi:MazG nucleotide pyrophosphohydrolase domain-containing protein [Solibacillus silvestris]|uniref:MazG nucleotide pyrophosphohydrolase domain-containing protein n=1 Tax=Solibacillus silvestris TaxID=76853 RepID=UPI003F802CDC
MGQLTFQELQQYLSLKYKEGRNSSGLFMKLVEEVGEVAEVLNQMEGRKSANVNASLEKELVDVIHYAVAIASINNIDLANAKKPPVKQRSYIPIILPAFIMLTAFFVMINISPNGWSFLNSTIASTNSESIFEGLTLAEMGWSVVSSIELIFIYILAKKVIRHTDHWKANGRVQELYAFLEKPILPKAAVFLGLIFIWAGTVYFSSFWYSQLIFVLLSVLFITLIVLKDICNHEQSCCPHCQTLFTRKQIFSKTYMAYREKCDSCQKPIYLERRSSLNKIPYFVLPLIPIWLNSLHFAYVLLFSALMVISLTYFYVPFMVLFTDKDTPMEDMKKGQ